MEHSFIAWAKQRGSTLRNPMLGIGDDAAILASSKENIIVTTDALCEGSHFILAECGGVAVGRKLAGVNLSDIAAMGASARDMFLTLCLPKANVNSAGRHVGPSQLAVEIFEGVYEYAKRYDLSIAGGDTNTWDGPLVVSLTAVGSDHCDGAWRRGGAKVGDYIVVSGRLGGSILGRHLRVEPRLDLAAAVRNTFLVSAAADISDGLGIDLLSITSESRCGAELLWNDIPVSEDAVKLSQRSGRSPIDHAFSDGEDFELLLAVPSSAISNVPTDIDGVPLTKIGRFVSRTGLWSRESTDRGDKVRQLPPKGYTHRAW